jgi:hypothetical protein
MVTLDHGEANGTPVDQRLTVGDRVITVIIMMIKLCHNPDSDSWPPNYPRACFDAMLLAPHPERIPGEHHVFFHSENLFFNHISQNH